MSQYYSYIIHRRHWNTTLMACDTLRQAKREMSRMLNRQIEEYGYFDYGYYVEKVSKRRKKWYF